MSLLSKTIFSVHCRICEYLGCGSGREYSVLMTNIIGNLISPKGGERSRYIDKVSVKVH